MRTFFVYLSLELKKTIKSVPYFFAGAIVLALFTGTIAFSAGKLLYGESSVRTIEVGVVMPGEDVLANKAMKMIESLDSVGSLCHFTYLEEEEGLHRLKNGEIFALMKLPEGLVEGIMDGTNLPVTVVFSEHSGLEAAVFRELTEAGSSILDTSQAGIYAADAYLYAQGAGAMVPLAEEELNRLFLSYALSRSVYFRQETVSAVQDVGTAVYFAISSAVMLLLFLGIPAAPLCRPLSPVLRQKLTLLGIGRWKQTAVRLLCLGSLLLLVSLLPCLWCVSRGYVERSIGNAAMWILICMTAAAWIQMFYELCRNTAAAILFLFTTTAVMIFISGGLLPSVFLPEAVSRIGAWTPAAFLMDGIRFMVTGSGQVMGNLLLTLGLCYTVSAAAGGRE